MRSVEFIFYFFPKMKTAYSTAPSAHEIAQDPVAANQTPATDRGVLAQFQENKIVRVLEMTGASIMLTACLSGGNTVNTATVPLLPALTLAQIAPNGIVMNPMVSAGQNTTASITPSVPASQIAAVDCSVNNAAITRVFPDANGTYACNMQSFNLTVSQNIGDNSVTFDVYEANPNGGYGAKTSVVQPFSVDATGTITMGQPTAFGVATPSISSVPSAAGQNGFPPMDVPFTATDLNGVSSVQAIIDRPSAVPPMSAVGGTWTLSANSGVVSSVASSVPVSMPAGTVAENINIIWKVRDRLGNVTSSVIPATTY